MSWVVTAPAVGVSVPAAGAKAALRMVILEQGMLLPDDVPVEQIKRLEGKGLIEQPKPAKKA